MMRASSSFSAKAALRSWPITFLFLYFSTSVLSFTPVPTPNLDLSHLGRVTLTGDFDAISLYKYEEQNENPFSTNGSQSLLTQMPNGAFATLASADADIMTMCSFIRKDGSMMGVVVGGNFTSLGGTEVQGVAMFDPSTSKITPLPGLSGQVSALFCDQDTDTVYVGGDFKGANSTNAIAWVGMAGWANLPFAGFNGPVNSIAKLSNGNVIFGGSFTDLGNTTTPTKRDQQVINLSTANISAVSSSSTDGFSDPSNIVCQSSGQDGPGTTWLLADAAPGSWKAEMSFGYQPTKLRLWNTHQDGRGTKTFRFTAFPINGIMNFTYTDPATNQNATCDARCPLSNDPKVKFQDFHFYNQVGMNSFQIDISDWWGAGAGLDGVELFQDDIYAYAIPGLNEPACSVQSLGSNATSTGPWSVSPSANSDSEYLSANLTGSQFASVTFQPDVKQSGNYSVSVYTPGCQQDNSCGARGIANVTATFASPTHPGASVSTQVYQTNDFDKYDVIYTGYVDANSDSFRPTITLSSLLNQQGSITLVAQRVGFGLKASLGGSGLNGLFEFNPNQATVDTNFSASVYDSAGTSLNPGAVVNSLAVVNGNLYAVGNLSGNGSLNAFSIASNGPAPLPNGGLNEEVATMFQYGNLLIMGGNFTDTVNSSTPGLNNVAILDTSSNTWSALGNGVNGAVNAIVPLMLNITAGIPETCITINGDFTQASGNGKNISVEGLAVWVPSQSDWLQNLDAQTMSIKGQLSTSINLTNSSPLLAGTLASQGMAADDAIDLSTSGPLSLNALDIKIQPDPASSSSIKRRTISTQGINGVTAGLFDTNGGRNITVLGGHFTASATNGSTVNNLAFVNNTGTGAPSSGGLTGPEVDSNSTFLALATQSDTLYAGGSITGVIARSPIAGLVLYDLVGNQFVSPQPPALGGSQVSVNAISARPTTSDVYVGGSFESAGSLSCPGLCVYTNGQWSRPGSGLTGSVSALTWQGNDQILVGGNLTVGGNATTLSTYNAKSLAWSMVAGSSQVPGPVTALTSANSDASEYWVSGIASNGSSYLMKYDGSNFQSVGAIFGTPTTIRGLQMLQLSQSHSDNNLVNAGMTLLVTGALNIPNFGNASAALFNGTSLTPFILSNANNGPGSLAMLFSEKQISFSLEGGHLALGLIVLIALACALGAIFLLVLAGIVAERYRRRQEGYRPAPTQYFDKTSNMSRIPPDQLFGSLGRSGAKPPRL